jgi:hypothetical protein
MKVKNARIVSVRNTEGKTPLGRLGSGWVDNIKNRS